MEERLQFSVIALAECQQPSEKFPIVLSEINTDFDNNAKNKLVSVILTIENSEILTVKDDYCVKVH